MSTSTILDQVLPKGIVPATMVNPSCMLIYSEFKVGKSELAGWLSRNRKALWLDYEQGSEAQDAHRINVVAKLEEINRERRAAGQAEVKKIDFLLKLWAELAKESPRRYEIIIHDKIDTLEGWAERWATAYFKNTVIGKNFTGSTVLELPDGGGYLYLRERFEELWNAAVSAAPHSIFMASLRSRWMGKENTAVESKDLDLTGKVRKIAAGFADAPAYLYRSQADGANYLSFKTGERGTFCGCRVPRLEGREFKLSWKGPDGKVVVDWGKIWQENGAAGKPAAENPKP